MGTPLVNQLAYSIPQVAVLLSLSDDQVRELVNRGDLPSMKVGRRILVTRYELEAWVKANGRATFAGMGEAS